MNRQRPPVVTTRAVADLLAGWQQWRAVSRRVARSSWLVLLLALSPSTYRNDGWQPVARQIYYATAPVIVGFTLLLSVFGLVLIRIVVVTAQSYGLSDYALEMVVRVLVLELIPLSAALFVAVRYSLPAGAQLSQMRDDGAFSAMQQRGLSPIAAEVVPRFVAGVFAVAMLVAVTCVFVLVAAYLVVYGLTPWAFAIYTHQVGKVLTPVVVVIFALKTVLMGFAVALIPVVSSLYDPHPGYERAVLPELQGLVRMFVVILCIEMLSLVGNYY